MDLDWQGILDATLTIQAYFLILYLAWVVVRILKKILGVMFTSLS